MIQLGKKATITAVSTLVLFGAVIAGVAIASAEDFDPIHAPDWKAGYSFSYDVTADIESVTDGSVADDFGVPGATNLSFGPFPVKKEILSTQYEDADGYPVYVSAATFPFSNLQSGVPLFDTFAGQQAFVSAERQNDLAPLPLLPDTSCRDDSCPGGGLDFLAGNDMSYLNFPLTPEKRWEQTINLPMSFVPKELAGIDRMHVVGEVAGIETVDLGEFGSTDAVRVDFSYTPVGLQEFVAQYAQTLEDAGLELERFNFQVGLHEIVYYSDELQAIVQQEYILYTFVDIAAKGEVYGHEIDDDIFAEVTARVKLVLTGANTEIAGKERTATEILEIVGDPALIADARGQGVGASPYTISLAASEDYVNAAESPMVAFALGVHGADALPEGATTSYEVTRAGVRHDESHRHTGTNDGFALKVDEPGVYDVVAKVSGPSGIQVAKARVVADWHEEVEAKCSLSLIGTTCAAYEFPVNAGLQEMTISVEAWETIPTILLGDSFTVDYADGDSEVFSSYDVAHYGADAGGHEFGSWSVSYRNQGDYFAGATYTISATYGGVQSVSIEAQAEPEGGDSVGGPSLLAKLLGDVDSILAGL